jgi:formyl-CoA transferase
MTGPLEGIRVLDFGRYIAGPMAARLLADLGADVVKIEDPEGDPFRFWQSDERSFSPQFAAYNRNKRSVVLDLRSPEAITRVLALVDDSDVLVENFRPGVMDRLGLGSAVLLERNPALVYCSISGFGATGPSSQRPSFDTIVSAASGLFSQILDETDPVLVGPAFSDLVAGLFAAQGVLAALVARTSTGRGQLVEVSMLAAILAGLLSEPAGTFLDTGGITRASTRQERAQAYAVAGRDGKPFVIHLSVPDKFWVALTNAIERPDLREDERFANRAARYRNYAALRDILREAFRSRTRDEWFGILDAADIPNGPLNGIDTVFEDPQVAHLGLVVETLIPGQPPLRSLRYPVDFSATPTSVRLHPPELGEGNVDIFGDLISDPAPR